MNFTVKFSPGAPNPNYDFGFIRVSVVDSAGGAKFQDFTKAQLIAQAVKADNVYTLTVGFTGLSVGAFTATATCWSQNGGAMLGTLTTSGEVSLVDGVWAPVLIDFS